MGHPNIYPAVVTDLPPKLKGLLDQYGREGQIDCDALGLPYLLNVNSAGRNVQAVVVRDGKVASIVINPRARTAAPQLSWDPNDGYRAVQAKPTQVGPTSRRERQMRESSEEYRSIVDQIWEG